MISLRRSAGQRIRYIKTDLCQARRFLSSASGNIRYPPIPTIPSITLPRPQPCATADHDARYRRAARLGFRLFGTQTGELLLE
jgi:hypothetical protein